MVRERLLLPCAEYGSAGTARTLRRRLLGCLQLGEQRVDVLLVRFTLHAIASSGGLVHYIFNNHPSDALKSRADTSSSHNCIWPPKMWQPERLIRLEVTGQMAAGWSVRPAFARPALALPVQFFK